MNKIRVFDILTPIAAAGIILWVISGNYGGMMIWFFSYPVVLILIIILYIAAFINTIIALTTYGYKKSKLKIFSHLAVVAAITASCIYNSSLFKPKELLSATLHDDLFHYTLTLRENNYCEIKASGFMGFEETYKGNYYFTGDTIIFTKLPYDNDNFIPKKLLLNKKENALFTERDKDGKFIQKKDYLNHFVIDSKNVAK